MGGGVLDRPNFQSTDSAAQYQCEFTRVKPSAARSLVRFGTTSLSGRRPDRRSDQQNESLYIFLAGILFCSLEKQPAATSSHSSVLESSTSAHDTRNRAHSFGNRDNYHNPRLSLIRDGSLSLIRKTESALEFNSTLPSANYKRFDFRT